MSGSALRDIAWYFGNRRIDSVGDALPLYGRDEFASVTRSTVPLLSLIKGGGEIWASLVRDLMNHSEGDMEAHLEYQVRSPKGRGKPSHTDLMLFAGDHAVAIEGKWTEPRYPTVTEWVACGNPDNPGNRPNVLNGWLSLIEPHAQKPLVAADFGEAVYQSVHRAASACFSRGRPTLAYLQFSPLPDGSASGSHLVQDLFHLHKILGSPDAFRFVLIEVAIERTAAFNAIANHVQPLEVVDEVRRAIHDDRLFEFRGYRIRDLRG
ncbi:MAG TPA: hypothetical protein VMU48_20440 [Terracidiphilus sp.]|nr:hypothetical protein [Terracidiphilus sp.]